MTSRITNYYYSLNHYKNKINFLNAISKRNVSSRSYKTICENEKRPFLKGDTLNLNKLLNRQGLINKYFFGYSSVIKSSIHHTAVTNKTNKNNILAQPPPGDPNDKPKIEHLMFIKDKMIEYLPKFFKTTHPYYLYTNDVVFENNFNDKSKATCGILKYAIELSMIRLKAHAKYSFIKANLIKVTYDENDSTVQVRWRIAGVSGFKSLFKPWKLRIWKLKESIREEAEWIDGFSTFYIRGDGRITKHRVDRIMTEKDEQIAKEKSLNKLKNLNVNTALFNSEPN